MKELLLNNSDLKVQISDEDYFRLMFCRFYLENNGYVQESTRHFDIGRKQQRLHIIIAKFMGLSLENEIDHEDGNKLNCQRTNLRIATRNENKANTISYINSTTSYKGVSWRQDIQKYYAHIRVNKKRINLGFFNSAEEAKEAYDKAAMIYFKEFARI